LTDDEPEVRAKTEVMRQLVSSLVRGSIAEQQGRFVLIAVMLFGSAFTRAPSGMAALGEQLHHLVLPRGFQIKRGLGTDMQGCGAVRLADLLERKGGQGKGARHA